MLLWVLYVKNFNEVAHKEIYPHDIIVLADFIKIDIKASNLPLIIHCSEA